MIKMKERQLQKTFVIPYIYYTTNFNDRQDDVVYNYIMERFGLVGMPEIDCQFVGMETVVIKEVELIARNFLIVGSTGTRQQNDNFWNTIYTITNRQINHIDLHGGNEDIKAVSVSIMMGSNRDFYYTTCLNDTGQQLFYQNDKSDEWFIRQITDCDIIKQQWIGISFAPNEKLPKNFWSPQFTTSKITISIVNNIIDYINDNGRKMIALMGTKSYNLIYAFTQWDIRYTAQAIGNTLIISDSKKLLEQLNDRLLENLSNHSTQYGLVWLNQYNLFMNECPIILVGTRSQNRPRLNIKTCNVERIIGYQTPQFGGEIVLLYQISEKEDKFKKIVLDAKNCSKENRFVLPYLKDNENALLEGLDELFEISENVPIDYIRRNLEQYVIKYFNLVNNEKGDVLQKWFNYCAQTTIDENQKLLKTYENLQKNLLNEYENCKRFLELYDFSKKKPVPAIELVGETKKHADKKINFTITTKSINNIGEIRLIKPETIINKEMRWVIQGEKKGKLYMGSRDLSQFYNIKTNTIRIDENELKGARYRD